MANGMETGKTVGEIAAENPAAASVFEKFGIDFCCGGKKPLEEACQERGTALDEVTRALAAAAPAHAGATNWTITPLSALIDHIVDTHHAYLVEELPLLQARARKVVEAHGERFAFLAGLARTVEALAAELSSHLMKEEMVLFPYIKKLEEGRAGSSCFGTVQNPIRMMEHEHDSAGNALASIRSLTSDFRIPDGVCNTFRALYAGLERLEGDLHTHIHLENNILFPRAIELEARRTGACQ